MKNFILVFLVLSFVTVSAQNNLVPNPSFEKMISKPKKAGELDKAEGWISPTKGTAELFSASAKSDEVGSPKNLLGHQYPRSGDNYAGAILYDKKTPDSREYMQVELTEPLEAGKIYCVEFYVNVSDLSKHSIDLIGAHLSKTRITAAHTQPLKEKPQILNKASRILEDQNKWEIICGEYLATGGEKVLTIGNFHTDKDLKFGKMKKPKDVVGSQNEYAYYFVDDVSVIEQDDKYKCNCHTKMFGNDKMNVVYKKTDSKIDGVSEKTLGTEDLIQSKQVMFANMKADIPDNALEDLKLIVRYLVENPEARLRVIGYADDAELRITNDLDDQRSQKVSEFFIKNAIRADRIVTTKGKVEPGSTGNNKVKFKIIK
jgi:outer membrane protein OmpA-like peptidoglycan-associated protein